MAGIETLKIELRYDTSDPEKVKILHDAAKIAAKHLFTTALLISDKRKPQIVLHCDDMFCTEKEISLAEDL